MALLRYPSTVNRKADLRQCEIILYTKNDLQPIGILSFALMKDKFEAARLLLESSEVDLRNMCVVDKIFQTLLHQACKKGRLDIMQKIIEKDADLVNVECPYKPIFYCVQHDNITIFLSMYKNCNLNDCELSELVKYAIRDLAPNIISFSLLEMNRKNYYIIGYDALVRICEDNSRMLPAEKIRKQTDIYKMLYNFLYPETKLKTEYDLGNVCQSLRKNVFNGYLD